jgi:ABC-type Fe3+-hydroxamate transport system substrate-binding protein
VLALVVTLLLALLLAACGGGGGGSSKSAYLEKVNRLCREAAAMRRTLVPPSNATPQQLVNALKQAVAVDQQLQQRITALSPPDGDAPTIREMLALMGQSDQVALQLADAIQTQNAVTMRSLYPRFNALGAQTRELANRYGLTACTDKV